MVRGALSFMISLRTCCKFTPIKINMHSLLPTKVMNNNSKSIFIFSRNSVQKINTLFDKFRNVRQFERMKMDGPGIQFSWLIKILRSISIKMDSHVEMEAILSLDGPESVLHTVPSPSLYSIQMSLQSVCRCPKDNLALLYM